MKKISLLFIFVFFTTGLNLSHAQQQGEVYDIVTTTKEILGDELATAYENVIGKNEEIKWSIYVPKNYNPNNPPGIFVHNSHRNLANMPFGWSRSMDDKNLIWISLNYSGRIIVEKQMLLAVLATPFLQNSYTINTNRIYSYSSVDACAAGSAAAQYYPNIFKGNIYSTCVPYNWRDKTPETIVEMRQNKFVFLASRERNVRLEMRRSERNYNDDGISKTTYTSINDLTFGKDTNRRRINQAIDFLDSTE